MAAQVATMHNISSADILFPEENSANYSDESFYTTASGYSTFSQEVKYIFDPEAYAARQVKSRERDSSRNEYSEISQLESVNESDESGTTSNTITPGDTKKSKSKKATKESANRLKELQTQEIYTPPHRAVTGVRGHRTLNSKVNTAPRRFVDVHSRRRTWSPPTCSRSMGNATSFHTMRSYRSNDQLDMDYDDSNLYEELDLGPPKITPISGRLNRMALDVTTGCHGSTGSNIAPKTLIKPIAYKPVPPPLGNRYVSTPNRQTSHHSPPQRPSPPQSHDLRMSSHNHSQDDGYVSQEYNSVSHSHSTSNTSNLSHSSYHLDCERPYNTESNRPASFTSSNLSRLSASQIDAYLATPSPSDSGVGELEMMLREKDAEIHHLRETMENNEAVIFKVYEEKRQNWEVEIRELHEEWERRLRYHQQKAFKMEQALLLQLFKLQQERKNLRLDVEQIRTEKERVEQKYEDLEDDYRQLKAKMEELQWDMCQKTGEISLLKSQVKDAKEESNNKSNDLIGLKGQLRDFHKNRDSADREIQRLQADVQRVSQEAGSLRAEVERLRQDSHKPKAISAAQSEAAARVRTSLSGKTEEEVVALKLEMEQMKEALEKSRGAFEKEREQWLDEKNKVIRYQKHLQLNYVQMYRKNKMLEREVEQLMVELENRDIRLSDGGQATEESMC